MAWALARSHGKRWRRRIAITLYVLLGAGAIWINRYQGLYRIETGAWNGWTMAPDVDSHPEYALDWRYPQFAATQESLCARNREYQVAALAKNPARLSQYALGSALAYDSGPKDPPGADRDAYLELFRPSRWLDGLRRAWEPPSQPSLKISHRVQSGGVPNRRSLSVGLYPRTVTAGPSVGPLASLSG